eukprot:TRINITY_DN5320_c0_g1_i1.p1 TRINITY_DN5320_c0_g1~~TRINITY_DN5320_c0_g1_i1.p1  ORF type:complete len:222 (-),score=52.51 TRINITY_DN5320_c0_g1_i1:29-694(-)
MSQRPLVGVLALQGGFAEHSSTLRSLGVHTREVRKPQDLHDCVALVMPGGESTTMAIVAESTGMLPALREWVSAKKPTFGTCAGMIFLADNVVGQKKGGQLLVGGLNVTCERNHFGTQLDSFETKLLAPKVSSNPIPVVFIRAPIIKEVGSDVEILCRLDDGRIVAVEQGHILGASFHPELTSDPSWHRYFLTNIAKIDLTGLSPVKEQTSPYTVHLPKFS